MEEAKPRDLARAYVTAVHTRLFVTPRYERRFHAFSIGTERSGTHSIAAVFAKHYRSDHEPDYPWLIRWLASAEDRPTFEATRYLEKRDRRLWLEIESCWLHILQVEQLARTFPDAKFVITIRNCYSWLDSLINHLLAHDIGPHWRRAHQLNYQPERFAYETGEEVMEQAGLYPIRAYLSAWGRHYQRALSALPEAKRLVIRTTEIRNSAEALSRFLGVPTSTIDGARGHQDPNPRKRNLLEEVDRALLEDIVEEHCAPLMAQWFPHVRNVFDAVPKREAVAQARTAS